MDAQTLLKSLGFHEDPFVLTNADQEMRLREYFVPPPYFGTIKGDPDRPTSTVVLAPRGGGKSAQRRMLELYAETENIFAVTYDNFFLFAEPKDLSAIDMNFHIENIVVLTLLTFLNRLESNRHLVHRISNPDRQYLFGLCRRYFEGAQPLNFHSQIATLMTMNEHFRVWWNNTAEGPVGSAISALASLLGLSISMEPVPLPKVSDPPRLLLAKLFSVIKRAGFRSILILVDKVDETTLTTRDPRNAYRLIQPLIRDLTFINSNEFGIKFSFGMPWSRTIERTPVLIVFPSFACSGVTKS